MSASSVTLPDTDPSAALAADDWARPMLDRELRVLGELAELGLGIARGLERQVNEPGAPVVVEGDVALAFGRAARAVRLTVALQARLIKELQELEASLARAAGERGAEAELGVRRRRVERIVNRVIMARAEDAEAADSLVNEASERLEDDDIYGDLLSQPISVLVASICEDLGLSPDWPRLAREAWAQAEIKAGALGSPLAAFWAADGGWGACVPIPDALPGAVAAVVQAASP